jgi:hypothetical protein
MSNEPRFDTEPGWFGQLTRNQAEGALPNGSRIVKCRSEPNDAHPNGCTGTVLGSIGPRAVQGFEHVKYGYCVEWDSQPRIAQFVLDYKISPAAKGQA